MNWVNDHLSRRIVESEHETVRQQWNKASLEKSVSEIHERQQDKRKAHLKDVSPLSVLLLFPLIVKYKKHNYFWMGGVSIISGTLFRVRREPFPTSKITMLIINVCCLHLYYLFSSLSIFAFFILPLYKRLLIFESWISYIEETYKY